MEISLRVLRSRIADCDPAPPTLTPSQRTCLERIRLLGIILLSEFGFASLTPTLFAQALKITREKLRFHFADLHALAGELMREHLQSLARAIGQVDSTDPEVHVKRRAAWLAYTRTQTGALTAPHLLLVRDLHLLAPDEREGIELTYRTLGQAVAGTLAPEALSLLDNPALTPAEIEHRLRSVGATHVPLCDCDPTPPPAPEPVGPTNPVPLSDRDPTPPRAPNTVAPTNHASPREYAPPQTQPAPTQAPNIFLTPPKKILEPL